MSLRRIKIGTRGSPLALIQTEEVVAELRNRYPDIKIETVIIKTSGDKFSDLKLERANAQISTHSYSGKGLFVKEIEEALTSGRIDAAVHSLKDVPARLARGLKLTAYLDRADPRDVFVSKKYRSFGKMPKGIVLSTSSPRRAAQVLKKRPDIKITPLRGNVHTRLKKLEDGECDATILAAAGLERLGLLGRLGRLHVSALARFVPAVGQGVVCIETRCCDKKLNELLRSALNSERSERTALAERSFLQTVTGDCHTPIAAHAKLKGNKVVLNGLVLSPAGKRMIERSLTGIDPMKLGKKLGKEFVRLGARKIMKKMVLVTGLKCDRSKYPGADVVHLPLIKILKPSDNYSSLDSAIDQLEKYDWIVFTSQNAVESFMKRAAGRDLPVTPKIAAVGPATAEKLRSYGSKVDLMPREEFNSAELVRELLIFKVQGLNILFPRAKDGMDTIVKELSANGAKVDLVEAYRTVPARIDMVKWRKRLISEPPDEVVISSPSAARRYRELMLSGKPVNRT